MQDFHSLMVFSLPFQAKLISARGCVTRVVLIF